MTCGRTLRLTRVDLGKALEDDDEGKRKVLRWEQWCGIADRGRPSSLRLVRLNPPTTGARAYKLKLPELLHCNVVHKKKDHRQQEGGDIHFLVYVLYIYIYI